MKRQAVKTLKDGNFLLPKARINYPRVVTRIGADEEYDAGNFSAQMIWEDEKVDLSILEKEIEKVAKKAGLKKGYRSPLRDGEERDGDDGYGEGTTFAKVKAYKIPPKVVWGDKSRVESDDEIIPGSYVNAIVSLFAYNKNGGKGVSLVLQALQCLGGGTQLISAGGGRNDALAENEFEETEVEDTEEPDDDEL
jgi:hypothetical protein